MRAPTGRVATVPTTRRRATAEALRRARPLRAGALESVGDAPPRALECVRAGLSEKRHPPARDLGDPVAHRAGPRVELGGDGREEAAARKDAPADVRQEPAAERLEAPQATCSGSARPTTSSTSSATTTDRRTARSPCSTRGGRPTSAPTSWSSPRATTAAARPGRSRSRPRTSSQSRNGRRRPRERCEVLRIFLPPLVPLLAEGGVERDAHPPPESDR